MKRIVSLLLLTPFAPAAHAQLQKGNLMVGGTGSLGFGGGSGTYFAGYLEPSAGLFLTDRLVVGSGIGLGYTTFRTPLDGRLHGYGASLSPYVRYYLTKPQKPEDFPRGFRPFAEAGATFSVERFNNITSGNTTAYVALGVNKFLTKNVALEGKVGYTFGQNYSNVAGLNGRGFGAKFGFQIFLDRAKSNSSKVAE